MLHQQVTQLVQASAVIVTKELVPLSMASSAKGTLRNRAEWLGPKLAWTVMLEQLERLLRQGWVFGASNARIQSARGWHAPPQVCDPRNSSDNQARGLVVDEFICCIVLSALSA